MPVVPMTKVAGRPPSTEPYGPGVEKFRDVIARRIEAAKAKPSEVFVSDDVRDRLIALSGGQLTELMRLAREAIIAHGLPIDKQSLRRGEIEGRRG